MSMRLMPTVLIVFACQAHAQDSQIKSEILERFRTKNLALVTTGTPPLAVSDAAQAASQAVMSAIPGLGILGAILAGGISGGFGAAIQGDTKLGEVSIDDPAGAIGKALASQLQVQYGMNVKPEISVAKDSKTDTLIDSAGDADWVLAVSTVSWRVNHFPTAWSRYQIGYNSQIRVIDVKGKTVISESACSSLQADKQKPTMAQLKANGANLLRYYLQQAQLDCADNFAKSVFDCGKLPKPSDILVDPFEKMRADDEAAIPDIQAKGKDDYKAWLAMPAPKAFAIADNGLWSYASSLKPQDTNAAVEPIARALANCKRNAKRDCQLFAVNNKYVLGSEFAAKAEGDFQASLGIANFAALPAQGSEAKQGQRTHSNFAKLEDVDLVPYLYERGRKGYEDYLKAPMPKAFAVSPSGYFAASVGAVSRDPTLPLDVADRALTICNKNSPTVCKLYAVGNDVVYTRD